MEKGVAARGRLKLLGNGSSTHGGWNAHLCKTITGCTNKTTHGPLPGVDRESSDRKTMRRLWKDAQDADMGNQQYLGEEEITTYLSSVPSVSPTFPGPLIAIHWRKERNPDSHGMRASSSSRWEMQDQLFILRIGCFGGSGRCCGGSDDILEWSLGG